MSRNTALTVLPFIALMLTSLVSAYKIAAESKSNKVGAWIAAITSTVCCGIVITNFVVKYFNT